MSLEPCLWIASASCFGLFFLLGHYVATNASLSRIDAEAIAIRGQATPLARFLTFTGRGPFLTVVFALMALAFWRFGLPVGVVALAIGSQFLSQVVIEGFKRNWGRRRPDYWLIGLERGFSYPSGHASTAITFFATFGLLVLLAPFPRPIRIAAAVVLMMWALGISWSRLALGAHYPTDVTGGTLFAMGWICGVAALCVHFHFVPFARTIG